MELAAFSIDLAANMAGASFVICFRCFSVESFSPSVVRNGFISSSSAGGGGGISMDITTTLCFAYLHWLDQVSRGASL